MARRDRFGVKPLYWTRTGSAFAFASRPRPLLALPGVSSAINRRFAAVFAGAHYRYIDNVPDESPSSKSIAEPRTGCAGRTHASAPEDTGSASAAGFHGERSRARRRVSGTPARRA